MDLGHPTGVSQSDDTFSFIPADFIYGLNKLEQNKFVSNEEKERYMYRLDHEHDQNPY